MIRWVKKPLEFEYNALKRALEIPETVYCVHTHGMSKFKKKILRNIIFITVSYLKKQKVAKKFMK